MCSLFGLIDFKECLSTHTKNKILNTLARECQVRGTDATGIAYNFNDRLRIYKRPLPARKMKIHIPHGVNVIVVIRPMRSIFKISPSFGSRMSEGAVSFNFLMVLHRISCVEA